MNPLLLSLAIALLLLASAISLWWWASSRQQHQEQSRHLQRRLASDPAVAAAHTPATSLSDAPKRHPFDDFLLRAGMQRGWRTPLAIGLALAAVLVLGTLRMHSILGGIVITLVVLALLAFWLGVRVQRRRAKLVAGMPDFLENMVRLTSIGQSMPMAFQGASEHTEAPLRPLLQDVLRRMRAGVTLEEALHQSAHSYRLKELDMLESVLRMSSQYGGRTDQILQRMSDFMRDLEHAQQDLRSITSETRMASWVLGLLPLFAAGGMMLLNPDFFRPMFTHSLGHEFLLIALFLEALGAFLLYRLAKSL